MRIFIVVFLSFLVLCGSGRLVSAHPHTWIDVETSLLFNDKGEIIGLWQGWLFDDFYSAFTLEGLQRDKKGKYDQKALDSLAKTNLTNLSEYSYFTFIHIDNQLATYKPVTDYKTFVEGNRLWMEFTVYLDTPVLATAHNVDYAIYDPTYYVEMLHAQNGDPIQLSGAGAGGCGYELKKPEPPAELSLMAAGLDQNETAGDGIGIYFAERVIISCH